MTIETATSASPSAEPAPVANPSPAPETSAAPAAETGGAAPVVAQPTEAPAAAMSGSQPQPLEKTTGPSDSLLSAELKTAEPAAAPEAPAQTETAPAEEPPAIAYEFTLPEGVKLEDKALEEFKSVLGEHRAQPELAQKLLDRHIAEVNRIHEQTQQRQHDVWETTQTQWRDQVKADPEIGGSRFETTITTCAGLVRNYGGSQQEIAELTQALNYTGAGNNPAIIKWIARIGAALKEGRPAPSAPPAQPQTRAQRRYNASGANA